MFSNEQKIEFIKKNLNKEFNMKFDYVSYMEKYGESFWGLDLDYIKERFIDTKTFNKVSAKILESECYKKISFRLFNEASCSFYLCFEILPYITIKEMKPLYIQEEMEI